MPSRILQFVVLLGMLSVTALEGHTATETPDEVAQQIQMLIDESAKLAANQPERSIATARQALALALSSGTLEYELTARAQLGDALRRHSAYAESVAVLEAGLAHPATPETRAARARLHYYRGRVAWNQGKYAAAETTFLAVQREAEALNDRWLLAHVLNNRGIVASNQDAPEEAIALYRAGLGLAEADGDDELRPKILNNLALLLHEQGEVEEPRAMLQANLALRTANGNRRGIANALVNLATIETSAGNHTTALELNLQALALREALGVPRLLASGHMLVARSLTALGRPAEALEHLDAAAVIGDPLESHELWSNIYTAFSDAHAAHGDYRQALDFQRRAEREKQLVYGEKTAVTLTKLREEFAAEKRLFEISELKAEQERQAASLALTHAELSRTSQQRYGLAVFIALGGIAVLAIIGRQRTQARAEKRILEETRRARDAAEQATALKSRLLDLASHDLKTPLIGIMMTADLIKREGRADPHVGDRIEAIRQESQRMFELVQDLLDTSESETGELKLRPESLDLAQGVGAQIPEFTDRAARKRQQVRFRVEEPDSCRILGDPARLRQVVENLVDNALKFSPAGSTVWVTVHGGARVRLEVEDEGPGLTEEDRAALFQRFRRLSATPTGGETSTGLGLSLTHTLVSMHGGQLFADSTPGEGAKFVARFPPES
ncbi:ATP-binding protein [Synoicihabitans lomoniglobus]|uniref:histidine kinase n=1 Tax=Synoicihabitans lomoniglobus TaxID=2909285 RepID=A0AAE9ZSI4_9BACT|nr:ATP-binding protein [Opitutaceae bacterium LMO-M01]WED63451.1 ATP-binding protein [Opitutaceae bacterium LMO-M01]